MTDNPAYKKLISLMTEKEGMHINQIKETLIQFTNEEFNGFVGLILEKKDFPLFEQFVYYLTLFRELPSIKAHLSNEEIPLEGLEHIIMFTYASARLNNVPEDQALDNVLIFIDQQKYLDLLLKSEIISNDKLLCYYIITKLDRKHIDIFFNQHSDITTFLDGFIKLPEKTIKTILAKNPDLFGYMSMFLQTMNNDFAQEFITKYEIDIKDMEKIKQIILNISNLFDIEKEKDLPLSQRNKKRLMEIIREVKEMNNIFSILHTLESEGVIIDEIEETLIGEILSNPMFKNILTKYGSPQGNSEKTEEE